MLLAIGHGSREYSLTAIEFANCCATSSGRGTYESTTDTDALSILAVGKVAYATVGFAGIAPSMVGLAWVATLAAGLTAAMSVVLNWALIPVMSREGAVLSTSVSVFSLNAVLAGWMKRKSGVNITSLGK